MCTARPLFWMSLVVLAGCASNRTGNGTFNAHISSPFDIVEAVVRGDSLWTTLRYGGGFRTHTFALEATGAATKSLPRQQPLRLVHDADGDMGRALISEDRSFDLRPFRDPGRGMIVLRLEGWHGRLEYTYTP
ncbi:MAG: hypothetical protein CMC97_02900 [Flavobacteriales bacterium]|nr:hypothetical protein [Flavobacteriales bacterium]